jgi:molybdopterin molybdotransferase
LGVYHQLGVCVTEYLSNQEAELLSIDSALSLMLESVNPLAPLDLPLLDAHGATLASNLLIDDEVILPAGKRIGPKEIGLAASFGLDHLPARPHPRVVVLSAGADLVAPGSSNQNLNKRSSELNNLPDLNDETAEQLSVEYESNSWMLTTLAREVGAKGFRVHSIAKDPQSLKLIIEDQLVRADLLVISGEERDDSFSLISDVLMQLGEIRVFRTSAQINGRFNFGQIGIEKVPVLTLPGEPIINYLSALLFVKPLIERMLNSRNEKNKKINLKSSANIDLASFAEHRPFADLIPVALDNSGAITVVNGLSDFSVFVKATHLLTISPSITTIKKGDLLELIELD